MQTELPARPNLEHYRKRAKDLAKHFTLGIPDALIRIRHHHPRFHNLPEPDFLAARIQVTDAQLVIAREHGFESWPKFARHIETLDLIRSVAAITDPVAAFVEVACVPRHTGHSTGTLEHAEMILARYPEVPHADIYTASILADEPSVRRFLSRDPSAATAKGGLHGWDALTYLCFSRYLRLDPARSDAFLRTAHTLLEAGASANTGWYEMIDHPNPRPVLESALYGAAGIARHQGLTRLLLERGADPNDEETPYHVPEGRDNAILKLVLETGRLNPASLAVMLVRKADWHDEDGVRLVLSHGADPNQLAIFHTPLYHSVLRDNALTIIEQLLSHGGDPALKDPRSGRSTTALAARRGRADVLELFEQRGIPLDLQGVDVLIAACAKADRNAIASLVAIEPHLIPELLANGGDLLAEFAGNGNGEGLRCLLDLGVNPAALYRQGDGYFDIARDSTALHVAAWRAQPNCVKELIGCGAPLDALDGRGRSALSLAVKACVDSYWTYRRSPDSVAALLQAGASVSGIEIPCGFGEVDALLQRALPN